MIFSILTAIFLPLHAEVLQVNKDTSEVIFNATGTPGFLKIRGTGGHVEGKVKDVKGMASGEITSRLGDFTTEINKRDDHMKNTYLEIKKYPVAKLSFKNVDSSPGEHEFKAELTIKGKTKPISGKVKIKMNDKAKEIVASFKLQVKDYPIGVPSFLGVTMADEVVVDVKMIAHP